MTVTNTSSDGCGPTTSRCVLTVCDRPASSEHGTPLAGWLRFAFAAILSASQSTARAETTNSIRADSVLIRLIDQVEVPARATGALAAIHVTEGRVVKQGDPLAQIDDAEAQLLVQRAKIEHKIAQQRATDDVAVRSANKAGAFARAEHQRLERAARELTGSVLQSELEEALLRLEQADLDRERAQRDLELSALTEELKENEVLASARQVELCKVAAPLSGVVVEVLRRPGEWVQPGDKVVRIVRMDRLRAEGFVQSSDAPHELLGAPATVFLDRPDGTKQKFAGEVVFVSPEINAVSGQVRVWVEVNNRQGSLQPGMRAKMTIAAPAARAEGSRRSVRESSLSAAELGGASLSKTPLTDSRP